ncbi:MAG: glycosyltransferase family 2 protein [Gemmataceae bacterium]|nr:glycosyltransferase family 2 protein [Gemmataceae bacterium]
MSDPQTLTVAIPFYTGKPYLQRAIESVLLQRHPGWELLVCDDCGPEEGIAELVQSYSDPRIHYRLNERNLGMAANWNRCLDLARTDLATLLHADDWLLEDYVGTMTEAAQVRPGAAALFCQARIVNEHGQDCFSFPDFFKRLLLPGQGQEEVVLRGRRGLEALLHGNFIMCPTVCYRKSILGARRFRTDCKMVQDLEFFTRLLLDGEALVGLPAVAYAYRRHPANATTVYTETMLRFREETALYDELSRAAAARGWARAARIARRKWIVKLHLLYRAGLDLLRRRPARALEKLSYLVSLVG